MSKVRSKSQFQDGRSSSGGPVPVTSVTGYWLLMCDGTPSPSFTVHTITNIKWRKVIALFRGGFHTAGANLDFYLEI